LFRKKQNEKSAGSIKPGKKINKPINVGKSKEVELKVIKKY
jgi:hypothetical protein